MPEFSTPMMRQYMEIKSQYADCLLFFRMGDFYELFMEDAHVGSQVLNITLTGKAGGKDGKIPMAGVPYHAADTYIARLTKVGYKVAICEQLSPPNKKGLVKRGVVRIVTPGTIVDENNLEKKTHNYIVAIVNKNNQLGLSVADLSTGYFALYEDETIDSINTMNNLLQQLNPSECIISDELYNEHEFLKVLNDQKGMNIFSYQQFESELSNAAKILKKHFGVTTLSGFGIAEQSVSHIAGAALITYLKETQNGELPHIRKIISVSQEDSLMLDRSTMINLELFSTIRENDTKGSLLSALDLTTTAMGGRMLKTWMKKPLIVKSDIEERYDAVAAFNDKRENRETIRDILKQIPDLERIVARLSVNLGNARDILTLKQALENVLRVKQQLEEIPSPLLTSVRDTISPDIRKIVSLIDTVFVEEPPFSIRDGGMIKPHVDQKLDTLRDSIVHSKNWIAELEMRERKRTGISSLKVRFNKVFGFYIEVSKTNIDRVPIDYIRKQTLVNGERFITAELKIHEDKILSAEEKINELEYKIFSKTLVEILMFTNTVQIAAESIARVDCLTTFSVISEKNHYTRPTLLYSGEIRIKQGRHPVVERLLDQTPFVPNDTCLDNVSQSLLLITGPNMAGKSVYIRQTALIVLMAQMGCFVPATSANITIVDKIFVRSGASDVITSGLSTFMVEMVETANILHNATEKSLIIMDEIGRGTSTYDGISLAWAVAEHLVTHYSPPPKVLFATHYHELQVLEEKHPGKIKNFHMAVTQQKDKPIFLHTILPGSASHSYGVAVAKLAGVPEEVIRRATQLLAELEKRIEPEVSSHNGSYITTEAIADHLLKKELDAIDIARLTPLEALNILATLKEKLALVKSEQRAYRERD